MTLLMFDSIHVTDFPATGMQAVAGYVGGNWPTFNALRAKFPNLPAVSIAVTSAQDAQCLDVETGDATPADVPAWLDRQRRLRPLETPMIYTSASQINAVRAAAGTRKYLLWSAHYGAGEHICGPGHCQFPAADATQFADTGPHGEHLDQTAMSPAFFAAIATKPAAAPAPAPKPVVKPAPKPVVRPPASSIPALFRKVVAKVVQVVRRPAPTPPPVLRLGSTGSAVRALQAGLNRVFPAYSKLTVDGDFGKSTDGVVRQFQARTWPRDSSMSDGVVGPATRAALARVGITF